MGKSIVITQPFFFPWPGLFEQIKLADVIVFYNDVQYVKRGLMNRVDIKTNQGTFWLTIPVRKHEFDQLINQIRIDNNIPWRRKHLKTISYVYKKAPYYQDISDLINEVYANESDLLTDITIPAILKSCQYLGIEKEFYLSSELNIPGQRSGRLVEICSHLNASVYITGLGALRYLDYSLFEKNGIRVEFINYVKKEYPQLHGEFNPYVSILDLIANTGNRAYTYLCSETMNWKDFIKTEMAIDYMKKHGIKQNHHYSSNV